MIGFKRNPYLIDAPALISLSGGRSSAYMLRMIQEEHGGELPAGVRVAFCNTGKERPETLDFVNEIAHRWGVPIVWLEWCLWDKRAKVKGESVMRPTAGFKIVDYATAARDGEPFAQLIERKNFLPNSMTRFCTEELKVKTCARYMRSLGHSTWNNVIGFRADEPHRVAKANGRNASEADKWVNVMPMAGAHVSKHDVAAFWKAQPFDLGIESWEGNCDGCFLVGAATMVRRLRKRPEIASWWSEQERKIGRSFRNGLPMAAVESLAIASFQQGELNFDEDAASVPCACHD